ncbi:MAG: Pectinesterase [Bacteroidetes bacterium]|nr:Pectinesterase [Bacteroidota bacterium]
MLRKLTLYILFTGFCAVISAQNRTISPVPRDTSYTLYSTLIKIRKNYPDARLVSPAIPRDIITYKNIIYKTIPQTPYEKRELYLNIYRPSKTGKLPVVLLIHGGGWSSGSPQLQQSIAVSLCMKGFAAVTVEYRLSPEAIYPAAVEDLNDALVWVSTNARTYRFDKNKIAVEGCSAGGQLATLLGMRNKDRLIRAVINIDGISTFMDQTTIDRAENFRKNGGKMPADMQWLGGTMSEKPEVWKDASAVYFVNRHSAPVCFINSSLPRFHNGRDELIGKLKKYNIYSEVHTFENSPHSFWLFDPWHQPTIDYASDFLMKVFSVKKNH